jgi:hypothetical protein
MDVLSPALPERPSDFLGSKPIGLCQPATFLGLELVKEAKGVREDMHYSMDRDLYFRLTILFRGRLKGVTVPDVLCYYLDHPATKTNTQPAMFRNDRYKSLKESLGVLGPLEYLMAVNSLRQLKTMDLVTVATSSSKARGYRLFTLPFKHPYVVLSRFFWGAIRRAVK